VILDGKLISTAADLGMQVDTACGANLMSDVLAFTHAGTLLLTGLTNPQVVRTAEMAGNQAIVLVRGRYPFSPKPSPSQRKKRCSLAGSCYAMCESCRRLYQLGGLPSCGLFSLGSATWSEGEGL
jgi:hypothetical protein